MCWTGFTKRKVNLQATYKARPKLERDGGIVTLSDSFLTSQEDVASPDAELCDNNYRNQSLLQKKRIGGGTQQLTI